MREIGRVLTGVVFVLSVVFVAPTATKAQALTSYLFLETVDSTQKPVSDAKAETTVYNRSYNQKSLQTDEKGWARFSGIYEGSQFLEPEFAITKPGYYPFQDFGVSRSSRFRLIKVELLKIPKSENERGAVGGEQKKREFLWAIQNGDTEAARKSLESGVNPNLATGDLRSVAGYENIPAIIFAAVSGDGATVELLLENGADLRRKNEYLSSILVYYLQPDPSGRHPSASESEKAKLTLRYDEGFKALVKAGADVNANGGAPLITAVDYGRASAVKILIASGADVNAKAYGGRTLLALAKEQQSYDKNRAEYQEIIKLLEAAGAK